MGVAGSGQDGDMAENLLQFDQVNPGFEQMGGVTVAQGMA